MVIRLRQMHRRDNGWSQQCDRPTTLADGYALMVVRSRQPHGAWFRRLSFASASRQIIGPNNPMIARRVPGARMGAPRCNARPPAADGRVPPPGAAGPVGTSSG